jgi:Lsr2
VILGGILPVSAWASRSGKHTQRPGSRAGRFIPSAEEIFSHAIPFHNGNNIDCDIKYRIAHGNGERNGEKVSVLLVDDIDGSEAKETISLSLDGTRYEIDLNSEHAQELRGQLERYVKAARKVTGSSGRPARVRRASADDKNKEVRDWARNQGLEVNERGRIPAHIVAKYEAENGK